MTILDHLLNSLTEDAPVRAILVGAHWTVVCSRFCGMASTLTTHHPHGHSAVREAGRLHALSARQLAEYARSDNLMEASIGVAAINSLIEADENRAASVNAVDVLIARARGKKIALVGHFPFIPKLRLAVAELWVLEQNPAEGDYPAEAAATVIPQADVVAITSTALINHTLDDLLALRRADAWVMMLGPSTPLSPLLFDHGVKVLSGSKVVDEAAVQRTVSQGASFTQVEGVRLLSLSADGQ